MVLMAPSPRCNTVSFPMLDPRPIAPSHPGTCTAAPPAVPVAELLPGVTPVVKIILPANPPERYKRSLLYVGDSATACTGRPKSRNATSLASLNEVTQTFPSIEDEAMYMAFEGVRGTGGCFGLLDAGEVVFVLEED